MSTWEARKKKSWKIRSSGNFNDFSKKFYGTVEDDVRPFLKEQFLRMVAESKPNRINTIELNVSIRGRKLKGVGI
jgi:hypothetical protein